MTADHRVVPDDGSPDARLVIIGEMPGKDEVLQRRPFVGWSGQKMAGWWGRLGLDRRRDMYITNVVPYRHNDRNEITQVPPAELATHAHQLHERLAALHDPWLIVPTGNTALRALTGKTGITKHRGSIYEYVDNRGRHVKVIPTIHAAALAKMPGWERRCVRDWERIAGDLAFRDLRLPEREHRIKPTLGDLRDYVADARERAEILVTDVETPRKLTLVPGRTLKSGQTQLRRVRGARRLTVAGFSFEPHVSLTVPMTRRYWGDDLPEAFALVQALLALPCDKGAQNHLFDRWWLAQYGLEVTRLVWDTRWLSHCLDPLDDHSLAYQASIWTREPYWKDDSKEKNDEADPGDSDIETFWRYNGKDCAVTRELVDVHRQRLADAGREHLYRTAYVRLYEAMHDLGQAGLRVDDRRRRLRAARCVATCLALTERLSEIAGFSLAGDGKAARPDGLSNKKLLRFLYETLRLPPQHDRKTKGLTAKEVTVRRLMLKYPDALREAGPLILEHRRTAAVGKFVSETVTDTDGRMHAQWGFTYTLRFTAGKAPNGRGANTQNTDRELLDLILPNPGHILLEMDLSQAEDRVVKMLTQSPRLIARARRPPWEGDEHTLAASLCFRIPQAEVTKDQRYIGKRTRHAGNYGEGGKTHSDVLLKEGYVYTPEQCDAMIRAVIDQDTPEVRDWQQHVRHIVLRDRALANTWGLIVDVAHERLSDDLYRKMYAWQPQSEVGMLTKLWGLAPLRDHLQRRALDAVILNEKHDSLLISTAPDAAWTIATFLRAALERPRRYRGEPMTIPCEFKLGRNGAMQHEWKRFPSRREFEDAAHALQTG